MATTGQQPLDDVPAGHSNSLGFAAPRRSQLESAPIPGRRTLTIGCVLATLAFAIVQSSQAADDARLREQVLNAIERGQRFIVSRQQRNGSWSSSDAMAQFENGTTGLAILALLNSGLKEDDPAVAAG